MEPNADFNGLVNISYNISDGTDETPVTTFRLIAINDAPVLDPDEQVQFVTPQKTPPTPLMWMIFSKASTMSTTQLSQINGLSIATDSAISGSIDDPRWSVLHLQPDSNVNGVVKLSYFVSDGAGANTLANNQFTVLPINDAPVRTAGAVNDLFLLEDSGTNHYG